jgi:hypothetical protein
MKDIMEGIGPLPLSMDDLQSPDGKIQIIDAAGGLIADFLDEDDAARVIHACNLYPELVEALEWILDIADKNLEQDNKLKAQGARTLRRIGDKAEAALAKCKAGAE